MRLVTNILIAICLCLSVLAESVPRKTDEDISSEIRRLAEIIERSAKNSGYETVKGSRPTDEWETEEKRNLVKGHAYYTLFGKDSGGSCVTVEGRIGVTILIFKDAEIARQHMAQMKAYHSDNIGIKIIRSDEKGYYLEEGNGLYAAVIKGSKVIFFEDRSRRQGEVIKSLSEALAKEAE